MDATMNAEHKQKSHQESAVEFLAKESNVSEDDVVQLYEGELTKLGLGAHIVQFLPIFAIRNVRKILHRRRTGKQTIA
jgi:Protein of unknown function (DUF3562)